MDAVIHLQRSSVTAECQLLDEWVGTFMIMICTVPVMDVGSVVDN